MSPRPDLSRASDQEMVECARQGREEAYRELLRRYERPVQALIYRMVRDHELAKDLAQETFAKVSDALESYRPDLKFSAWIFRIANNLALDYLRREELDTVPLSNSPDVTPSGKVKPTVIPVADRTDSTPARTLKARKLGPAIEQAIGRLRAEYRRCVILRFVEGRSYDEIADALGLPPGTVATYLHRARAELKAMLGPLLDAPRSDSWPTPA